MTASSQQADTKTDGAPDSAKFNADLLAIVLFLRAFAHSLTGKHEGADDLAQETLVTWRSRASCAPGTNLKAWRFTILRDQFYSDRRRVWRQPPWDAEAAERTTENDGGQAWAAELSDTARALKALPVEQRETLILVGAGGFAYEQGAEISKRPVGTVKSRVARGRKALVAILDSEQALPTADRLAQGDAAREIMAQLDRLAPADGHDAARRGREARHRTAAPRLC